MLAVAILLTLAVPDASSSRVVDGMWFDGAGNLVPLSTPPATWTALASGGRTAPEIVDLFNDGCLKTNFAADAPAAAVAARAWGFDRIEGDIGARSGEHLIGWQARDVAISASRRVWPLSECVVSARTASRLEQSGVVDALSRDLGFAPDRESQTRVTSSRRVQVAGFTARWRFADKSLHHRTIYAAIVEDDGAFRLNLAVTEEPTR